MQHFALLCHTDLLFYSVYLIPLFPSFCAKKSFCVRKPICLKRYGVDFIGTHTSLYPIENIFLSLMFLRQVIAVKMNKLSFIQGLLEGQPS